MLDEYIISAKNNKEFQSQASRYFVNMENNLRTLHKTGFKRCPYSKGAYRFLSFDTLDSVQEFEKNHKDMTPFRRCGNCFKR